MFILDRKIIFLGGGGVNDPLLIRGLAVIPKMGVTGLVNRCSPSPSDVMEKEGGWGGGGWGGDRGMRREGMGENLVGMCGPPRETPTRLQISTANFPTQFHSNLICEFEACWKY